jgi:hypothetical protein
MLKTFVLMLKKRNPSNAYSKTIQHFGERKTDISNVIIWWIATNQNTDFTVLNNSKFKNKPIINKEPFDTQKRQRPKLDFDWLWIGQRGGDLLKITNENIRYKAEYLFRHNTTKQIKRNHRPYCLTLSTS